MTDDSRDAHVPTRETSPERLLIESRRPDLPPRDRVAAHAYTLTCLAFLALGLWVVWRSQSLTYSTPIGPGPAFLPTWLGAILAALSLAVLLHSVRFGQPAFAERFLPVTGGPRIAVTVAAIAAFALLVERLGFVPTMFAIQVTLLTAYGCRVFPTAILVALAGSLGIAFAFTRWLGVYLPAAPGGILRGIGL